jgi:hypothetical protein
MSRRAAQGAAPRDIADKQIILSQPQAHSYARLYFRPRSPTQYRLEGIRKPGEYYHDDPDTHAPVLVIMVFGAEEILTLPGVCFSDANMQSFRANQYSTDDEFRNLPFDKIYHVGPVDPESDVIRRRGAEVLVPNSLLLEGRLQAVLCKSPAERATLLHMLGDAAKKWARIIRVYTEPGIFENRYAYVDSVAVSREGVTFKTHARYDAQPVRVDITISPADRSWRRTFFLDAAHASYNIVAKIELEPGSYFVEIEIDHCLAYKAISLVEDIPF